jgi:hypothetical protein
MAKNKRVATKHIRDGIKSQYPKGTECEICGTHEDLEYHHYHTLSILLKKYAKENGIPIDTDEQVLAMRDQFYEAHWEEVVTDGVTLCNEHHKLLHKIYGKEPALNTAEKQKHWVKSFRDKLSGMDTQPYSGGNFSRLIPEIRRSFGSLARNW